MNNRVKELFHNKVLLFNIAVIAGILIFLLIANIQQETDIEEYTTIPFDHDPLLLEEQEYTNNVELVYDKDTFKVDYRIFKFKNTLTHNVTTITEIREDRPLPMSPATSIFYIDPLTKDNNSSNNDIRWIIAVAVKKVTDEPAVYMLKVNDKIIAYFSDPFPTGYNSIIIYTLTDIEEVKIEISKVR